jgi:hypothetical protein
MVETRIHECYFAKKTRKLCGGRDGEETATKRKNERKQENENRSRDDRLDKQLEQVTDRRESRELVTLISNDGMTGGNERLG